MNEQELKEFANLIEELQAECVYFKNLTKQLEDILNKIHPKSNVLKYIKTLQDKK